MIFDHSERAAIVSLTDDYRKKLCMPWLFRHKYIHYSLWSVALRIVPLLAITNTLFTNDAVTNLVNMWPWIKERSFYDEQMFK